jgi:hypothetical protein
LSSSSHEAKISHLVEVNADLQRELEWKDAQPDAAVEAARKPEREREALCQVRETLQQRKEDVEERDDFKRQLREAEIALAFKESVDVDGGIRRAVAGCRESSVKGEYALIASELGLPKETLSRMRTAR